MIQFFKNLFNSGRTLIQKKGIEKIIRRFDASVCIGNDFKGYAFKSNIVETNYFPEPELVDTFGMHTSRHIDNKIASCTRVSEFLCKRS